MSTEDYTGKGCDDIPLIVPSVPFSLRYGNGNTSGLVWYVSALVLFFSLYPWERGEDIDRGSFASSTTL